MLRGTDRGRGRGGPERGRGMRGAGPGGRGNPRGGPVSGGGRGRGGGFVPREQGGFVTCLASPPRIHTLSEYLQRADLLLSMPGSLTPPRTS
jgi:hypothetical protein